MSQINVNTIKDKSGLGAPSFPNGVNATGVITATSFSGDGGNLTGIDASSLKVDGTTKVQATSTGLVITGIATASNFKTGSTNVHSVGVEAAGINVLGADTPIGTGSTIYDNGNAFFNGTVTAASYAGVGGTVTVSTSTGINRWHWSTGGHLIPNVNAAYDIGNAERKVRHLFLSDNSLKFVDDSNNPRNLSVTAGGNLKFDGGFEATSAIFSGNVSVGGTLTYEDVTNIDSVGLITARNGINMSGGTATFAGAIDANGALDVDGQTDLDVLNVSDTATFSGTLNANAGIVCDTNKFVVADTTGNTTIAGTLDVDGTTTLDELVCSESVTLQHMLYVTNTAYFYGQIDASGDVNLGNATSDTITCTGRFDSDLVPSSDNARDLGASGLEWKDLYLDGTANIDSLVTDNLTVSGTSTFTGSTKLNDDIQLQFGTDTDYFIKHDGSNCWHKCTTGNLELKTYGSSAGNLNFESKGSSTFKVNENTTALTLASDGNATFGGTVTAGTFSGTASLATLATNVTVTANNGNNENVYLAFVDSSAGGTQGIETDAALSYNPSTNALTTTEFIGGLTGNASGTSGGFTAGNASNLNSGTVASARLGSSGTRSSSTYLRGDNTWADDGCFIRADAADTATGRIIFNGNATSNHDDMASGTGSMGGIEVYNSGSGNDAFMAFHTGSDYALYFGLDADSNSLAVGGWSMGAVKHKIIHQGNVGSGDALSGVNVYANQFHGDGSNLTGLPTPSGVAILSGSNNFTNSYNAFGNGTGSVSNNGSWNARVNVAGSSHARLDVQSVSDGIITTMSAHTGHTKGQVGTRSNHGVSFIANGNERAVLTTGGAFSVTDTISDSHGELRKVPNYTVSTNVGLSGDSGKCALSTGNNVYVQSKSAGFIQTIINDKGTQISLLVSGVDLYNTADGTLSTASNGVVFKMEGRGMATFYWKDSTTVYMSGTQIST